MRIMVGALLLLASSTVWGQDYLYRPHPVTPGEQPSASDGVLVREVQVKKGDTLSRISRRFSGRGSYYPQILLFNSIKNPHLIYPGELLRVPVTGQAGGQKVVAAATSGDAKPHPAHSARRATVKKKSPAKPEAAVHVAQPAAQPSGEQASYQRAMEAYTRGDCSQAVQLFDRFIAEYPSSSLLSEATLNRAECYLKLSGQ